MNIQRTRGARRRAFTLIELLVTLGIVAEFVVLGALAGLLAASGASLAGWALAEQVLNVTYVADARVWLIGTLGGGALVAISGWLATRGVLRQPPATTLRAP